MRGPKPTPTALRRLQGNPGKRAWNHDEPDAPPGLPDCPPHLSDPARAEWRRIALTLHEMEVVTTVDRAALAAYCQCYGRWVEAEERLRGTPLLLRTPSGYVQQSPWLSVANKQLELMGRYMAELGITPASRSRVTTLGAPPVGLRPTLIALVAPGRDAMGAWLVPGAGAERSGLGAGAGPECGADAASARKAHASLDD